jgi:hypothetical protein
MVEKYARLNEAVVSGNDLRVLTMGSYFRKMLVVDYPRQRDRCAADHERSAIGY